VSEFVLVQTSHDPAFAKCRHCDTYTAFYTQSPVHGREHGSCEHIPLPFLNETWMGADAMRVEITESFARQLVKELFRLDCYGNPDVLGALGYAERIETTALPHDLTRYEARIEIPVNEEEYPIAIPLMVWVWTAVGAELYRPGAQLAGKLVAL
jgi:hypothetical protein